MAEFKSKEDVERWLERLPMQRRLPAARVLALRSALRVLPLAGRWFHYDDKGWPRDRIAASIVLPQCRCLSNGAALTLAPAATKELRPYVAAARGTAAAADVHAVATATHAPYVIADAYVAVIDATTAFGDTSTSYVAAARVAVRAAAIAARAVAIDAAVAYATFNPAADVWNALSRDATALEQGMTPEALAAAKLWPQGTPEWANSAFDELSRALLALDPSWQVWLRWYQARLNGDPLDTVLEVRRAKIEDADWKQGPAHVNALILAMEAERAKELAAQAAPTAEEIVAVASPAVGISRDGKVDATPNPDIDKPVVDDDLPTLPLRQMAVIATILAGLGENAPATLKSALSGYSGELRVRGVQPILGILTDMFAIVEGDRAAPDADQWLVHGLKAAFGRLDANHAVLMQHFPLNELREKVLERLKPDESHAPDDEVGKLAEEFAAAAQEALGANIATETFAKVAQAQAQSLDIVISMPPQAPEKPTDLKADPTDRIAPPASKKVSYRTRMVASLVGFTLGVIQLAKREPLGLTANLIQVFESASFERLTKAASALFEALRLYLGI